MGCFWLYVLKCIFLCLCFFVYVFKTHVPNMTFLAFCLLCGAYLCCNHCELYKVMLLNFTMNSYTQKFMFQMIMFLCRFLFLPFFMFCSCFIASILLGLVLVNMFLWCFVGYFLSIINDAFAILQTNTVVFKNMVAKD